jgi:hypothetical protein
MQRLTELRPLIESITRLMITVGVLTLMFRWLLFDIRFGVSVISRRAIYEAEIGFFAHINHRTTEQEISFQYVNFLQRTAIDIHAYKEMLARSILTEYSMSVEGPPILEMLESLRAHHTERFVKHDRRDEAQHNPEVVKVTLAQFFKKVDPAVKQLEDMFLEFQWMVGQVSSRFNGIPAEFLMNDEAWMASDAYRRHSNLLEDLEMVRDVWREMGYPILPASSKLNDDSMSMRETQRVWVHAFTASVFVVTLGATPKGMWALNVAI